MSAWRLKLYRKNVKILNYFDCQDESMEIQLALAAFAVKQCLRKRSRCPKTIHDSIKPLLTVNTHGWEPGKDICTDCLPRFFRLRDELAARFPQFADQEIKISRRRCGWKRPAELRGRGVTIAFLDAGFYAHPDLTQPANRILKYVNVTDRTRRSRI